MELEKNHPYSLFNKNEVEEIGASNYSIEIYSSDN